MVSNRTPYPPSTLYMCTYSILIQQGRGGGGWTREKGRGATQESTVQITKLGWKYQHDWMYTRIGYLQSINPQSPFTVKFFWWRHFALPSISLIFLRIFTCFRYLTVFRFYLFPISNPQQTILLRQNVLSSSFRFSVKFLLTVPQQPTDIVNSAQEVEKWMPTGRTWPHRMRTPHSWIRFLFSLFVPRRHFFEDLATFLSSIYFQTMTNLG